MVTELLDVFGGGGDETILKLIMAMVVQVCEYTENPELCTLNWAIIWQINYITNKAVIS